MDTGRHRGARPYSLAATVLVLIGASDGTTALRAQSRAAQLIEAARAQLSAHQLDSAATLLSRVLDSATHATLPERNSALVWRGIGAFLGGDIPATHAAFHQALATDTTIRVGGLERLSPDLAAIFEAEHRAAVRNGTMYLPSQLDEQPRRLSGPAVAYPPSLLRRHVQGRVEVEAVIDTLGSVDSASVRIHATPDSALIAPVLEMMRATRFAPGRSKGTPVRALVVMGVEVRLPLLRAVELTTRARGELAAQHADSALATLELALDSSLTHPSDGERAYALLVRNRARAALGEDSAAAADREAALKLYDELVANGMDLPPVLRRLADSVRTHQAPTAAASALAPPTTSDAVDEPAALVSYPPIEYPPEMRAQRVGATIHVEARLDTAGRVVRGSATVLSSPNHAFDAEARRVVEGSVYRPARNRGRPVPAQIRQDVIFVNE